MPSWSDIFKEKYYRFNTSLVFCFLLHINVRFETIKPCHELVFILVLDHPAAERERKTRDTNSERDMMYDTFSKITFTVRKNTQ